MSNIELINIAKIYNKNKRNERTIFTDFNLKINQGEYIAIIGRSGCGKSTLLNIIGQIDGIDSGKYLYNNVDISVAKDKEKAKFRANEVGFIFQDFALLEKETVESNLRIAKYLNNNKEQEDIDSILNALDIKSLLKVKCSKLSGGEKQRVAIARSLINSPSIILADELTGSLDSDNALVVMDILDSIHKQGKTIIMVTHDKETAKRADRIIEL
ncbi:MAG: ABC transporter ATP-binding protein [Erysipelotrichales bacterium]